MTTTKTPVEPSAHVGARVRVGRLCPYDRTYAGCEGTIREVLHPGKTRLLERGPLDGTDERGAPREAVYSVELDGIPHLEALGSGWLELLDNGGESRPKQSGGEDQ